MNILTTVDNIISFIKHGDISHVTLITACSNNIIYSDFYDNYPDEMKDLNVTIIEFNDGNITLYVL